jgi:hypothetical protein
VKRSGLFASLVLLVAACGDRDPPPAGPEPAAPGPEVLAGGPEIPPEPETKGDAVGDYEELNARGEALAKEVIAEFDAAVDAFAAALADKPDDDEGVAKLQAVYDEYLPKMEALGAKRKELPFPEAAGGFNRYMGENRGKAVFRKDNVLGEFITHYRMMKPGPKIVEFLTTKVLELLDVAHTR